MPLPEVPLFLEVPFFTEFIVTRIDVVNWEAKKQDGEVTHYGCGSSPLQAMERCYDCTVRWRLEHKPLAQVDDEE